MDVVTCVESKQGNPSNQRQQVSPDVQALIMKREERQEAFIQSIANTITLFDVGVFGIFWRIWMRSRHSVGKLGTE